MAACGDGLEDLSRTAGPLLTVRAKADPALVAGSGPVRATLVWADVPSLDLVCLRLGMTNPTLGEYCADPLRFVPGEAEPVSVPAVLEGGVAYFDIPVRRLPSTEVSVGDANGRIAWGSVVVGEDRDGDGLLGVSGPSGPWPFERPGSAGTDGSTDVPAPPEIVADKLLAASFATLLQPQQRLGFREGTFDLGSFFYPAPGCPEPPRGFSVVRASPYPLLPGSQPGPCEVADPRTEQGVLEVFALSERQVRDLRCDPDRLRLEEPGPWNEPPALPGVTAECLSENLALYKLDGDCPLVLIYALKGCRRDPECSDPDWDYTAEPPAWWPCPAGATP